LALSAPARLVDFRPSLGGRDANVAEFGFGHQSQLAPFAISPTPQLQCASPAFETWRRWPERDVGQRDSEHFILLPDPAQGRAGESRNP
jgi:hypothetical protein